MGFPIHDGTHLCNVPLAIVPGAIEPLPAVIPSDLYSFEAVQSEWEKQALEELRQAPKTEVADASELPPPPSLKKAVKAEAVEDDGGARQQASDTSVPGPHENNVR